MAHSLPEKFAMPRESTYHLLFASSIIALIYLVAAPLAVAEATFTYQGKLSDGGNPANGSFDFQFKLFDTATVGTGTQQGSTVIVPNVQVTSGIFTAQLDFGSSVFAGGARFLEIALKQTSGPTFTTLGPRQPLTANPYSVHSLNADGLSVACANCITSSQVQSIQGSQVTGSIAGNQISGAIPVASVPAGSVNYIQNATSQQASTNFNISGDGTIGGSLTVSGSFSLNIVNAQTQFNLASNRVLAAPGTGNFLAGINAGASLTTGQNNTLFGTGAGAAITTSNGNSFFGREAGNFNTGGLNNSFFGDRAGAVNTTGNFNSFFGEQAGATNTGSDNSFFGRAAGGSNTSGNQNSFFGRDAGNLNATGGLNSFFGWRAGKANTTGGGNSFFGWSAGSNNTTGCCNSFVGESAGSGTTTGFENAFFGDGAGVHNASGSDNTFIGRGADFGPSNASGTFNTLLGANTVISGQTLSHSTAIGANASVSTSNTIVLGTASDVVVISGLGAAGGTSLCRNSLNQLSFCSSSLRYKTDVLPFEGGLEIVSRLRPISFIWKQDGARDVGLAAEDVERVEPLLAFRNKNGGIEGVKYNQLTAVFINAFKQQQTQIERHRLQIEQQRAQIKSQQREIETLKRRLREFDAVKRLVCADHPHAQLCKSN